jgi:hypothetical protein
MPTGSFTFLLSQKGEAKKGAGKSNRELFASRTGHPEQ